MPSSGLQLSGDEQQLLQSLLQCYRALASPNSAAQLRLTLVSIRNQLTPLVQLLDHSSPHIRFLVRRLALAVLALPSDTLSTAQLIGMHTSVCSLLLKTTILHWRDAWAGPTCVHGWLIDSIQALYHAIFKAFRQTRQGRPTKPIEASVVKDLLLLLLQNVSPSSWSQWAQSSCAMRSGTAQLNLWGLLVLWLDVFKCNDLEDTEGLDNTHTRCTIVLAGCLTRLPVSQFNCLRPLVVVKWLQGLVLAKKHAPQDCTPPYVWSVLSAWGQTLPLDNCRTDLDLNRWLQPSSFVSMGKDAQRCRRVWRLLSRLAMDLFATVIADSAPTWTDRPCSSTAPPTKQPPWLTEFAQVLDQHQGTVSDPRLFVALWSLWNDDDSDIVWYLWTCLQITRHRAATTVAGKISSSTVRCFQYWASQLFEVHRALGQFMQATHYDAAVMVDYLSSEEVGELALRFLLGYSSYVRAFGWEPLDAAYSDWQRAWQQYSDPSLGALPPSAANVATTVMTMAAQGDKISTDKSTAATTARLPPTARTQLYLAQVRDQVQLLHAHSQFPYNPEPLIRKLTLIL
ncbi:hypothetical protein H4R34_003764 [Dimargaris verticillata]|uniref:Uncharacterized protein n=1 Tax=Dimargaris verticillata TaxID=2761393 RepID=A0A9W8AZE8_9FUNG|nr:hypothetical protein H4R34_003764 [Dimargaris verticillata]